MVRQLLDLLRAEPAEVFPLLERPADRLMEIEGPCPHLRAGRALLIPGIGAFPCRHEREQITRPVEHLLSALANRRIAHELCGDRFDLLERSRRLQDIGLVQPPGVQAVAEGRRAMSTSIMRPMLF